MNIYDELKTERARQDETHGGIEHDVTHPPEDWIRFIREYAISGVINPKDYRKRMIQVGALAIAAVEAFDHGARSEKSDNG